MPPPLFCWGREVEPPTKFSNRRWGGLTGPQLLEGSGWKRVTVHGGCSFHIKNKLKSEIFNDKKSL